MSEKKPTIAELQDQLSSVREASNQHRHDLEKERATTQALRKELAAQSAEISFLKDELHRLTIENARLKGYQDRVREFDPVTERTQYADRHHPQRDTGDGFNFDEQMARYRGDLSHVPTPWYRRG